MLNYAFKRFKRRMIILSFKLMIGAKHFELFVKK